MGPRHTQDADGSADGHARLLLRVLGSGLGFLHKAHPEKEAVDAPLGREGGGGGVMHTTPCVAACKHKWVSAVGDHAL